MKHLSNQIPSYATPLLPIPQNEAERLKNLAEYSILDSLPEREYNEITQLASYICQTPISQLNIIDETKQWTKSVYGGTPGGIVPREESFCNHTVNAPNEILVIPDARRDRRFFDNPNVTCDAGVVFYAGVALVSPEGYALGALCVVDSTPRNLTQAQLDALKALANQIISLLELRRNKKRLEKAIAELGEKNEDLEKFAYVVAHDIKSPMNNILGLTRILQTKYAGNLNAQMLEVFEMLTSSTERLKGLVDGILEHSRSEKHVTEENKEVDIRQFVGDIIKFSGFQNDCNFILPVATAKIGINKTALSQVLINLITNAIKYNDKEEIRIEIGFSEAPKSYSFWVKDNGPGIDKENHVDIFGLFKVFSGTDRFGNRGTGIGLATVKKLVENLKGEIMVDSESGKGAVFTVVLPK